MNTPDLTEKLKELLMKCDLGQFNGLRVLDLERDGLYPSLRFSEVVTQQLAPEIEKMINQPQTKE